MITVGNALEHGRRRSREQKAGKLPGQAQHHNQHDHPTGADRRKKHDLKERRTVRPILLAAKLRIERWAFRPLPRVLTGGIAGISLEDRIGDRLALEDLIVLPADIRLTEHRVGGVEHFGSLFGFPAILLPGMVVRMGIPHQVPVGTGDLGTIRRVRHVQNLVVIDIRIELATMSSHNPCVFRFITIANVARLSREYYRRGRHTRQPNWIPLDTKGQTVNSTDNYSMEQFIEEASRIIAESGHDGNEAAPRLFPLVERAVWLDGLLDESKRVPPESGRSRFYHYRAPDESLLIYVVEFVPGMPTPTHDHVNWGLIGVCGGKQLTTLHERVDDGSNPDYAELTLLEHRVRERGEVHALVAPRDIHTIETVGDEPSYSLHVIGGNLTRSHRHIFDVETGKVTHVTGQRM